MFPLHIRLLLAAASGISSGTVPCRRSAKLRRASSSQTCPLLPQLQKSGTTSHTAARGLRTERIVLLTSDGVETLEYFSTICKVHILFDHLIEHVAFHLLGQVLEPYSIVLFNKQTLDRIHDRLRRSDNILDVSLNCDRWIASSLLQKSIRRGEVELAQRAACTLHAFDRSAIWRRLVVIVCEDVGVGDIDALLETLLAATSIDLRRQRGEASVLGAVVRRLAEAVKDRSGDYLACAAADHPDLSATRRFCKEASLEKRLELLADFSQPLAERAVAAWYASGINPRYQNQVQGGDLHALAAAYRSLG